MVGSGLDDAILVLGNNGRQITDLWGQSDTFSFVPCSRFFVWIEVPIIQLLKVTYILYFIL